MKIAVVQNNSIVKHGELTVLFPQTSFSDQGPSDDFLQTHNCRIIIERKTFDQNTQKLVIVQPYIEGNEVYNVEVQPISEEEIQQKNHMASVQVREKRNGLIAQSDWTQLADSPADKTAWATYRQALRDIPEQEGFPNTIQWPTPPNAPTTPPA